MRDNKLRPINRLSKGYTEKKTIVVLLQIPVKKRVRIYFIIDYTIIYILYLIQLYNIFNLTILKVAYS